MCLVGKSLIGTTLDRGGLDGLEMSVGDRAFQIVIVLTVEGMGAMRSANNSWWGKFLGG